VEVIVSGYMPQQADGDSWSVLPGMRRFSPIGGFWCHAPRAAAGKS